MSVINSVNSNMSAVENLIVNVNQTMNEQVEEVIENTAEIIQDTVTISEEGKKLSDLARQEKAASDNIIAMSEMIIDAVQL